MPELAPPEPTGSRRTVLVVPDPDVLAGAVAARLLTVLADAQALRGTAGAVLTGGGVGIAALAAVAGSPARQAVDWSRVDLWWGDERWVPASDDERNERQAREALLDGVGLDPSRVHPMGAEDGEDPDADGAAERYAAALLAAGSGRDEPLFDVVLLGMGPEGHVASIFPESPAAHDDRLVFAVHGCPKPPPMRISLGFAALNRAREAWFLVAGEAKAAAVAMALAGAGPVQLPAAGVVGLERTLWLLDEAAASRL